MAILLSNSFEGGSNGVTLTPLVGGNTGGASGDFFNGVINTVPGTIAFDSTHAAHGSLSMKIGTTTASQTYCHWNSTSITGGPYAQMWYRTYLYLTANPTAQYKVVTTGTGAANCGSVYVTTAGKIICSDGSGTTRLTSAASVPLNAWFRLEGFMVGSATVGQVSFSMWTSMDSAGTATETQTSAASFNTTGAVNQIMWGSQSSIANVGPYWMDDVAISATSAVGPVSSGTTANAGNASASAGSGGQVPSVALNMTIQGV